MIHILTFDIEEWFHAFSFDANRVPMLKSEYDERIEKNLDDLLCMLNKYNRKATFFVSGWIARHNPWAVKQILKEGHELGLRAQTYCRYEYFSEKAFREYIHRNVSEIGNISGQIIKYYRSSNSLNSDVKRWVIPVLAEKGIEVDSSLVPLQYGMANQSFYDLPCWIKSDGVMLKEISVNTVGFQELKYEFSEQGNRILTPYWLIRHIGSLSDYLLTYFHAGEFEDITVNEELHSSFSSFFQNSGEQKLDSFNQWIGNHDFINLSQAIERIEWKNKCILNLHYDFSS